MDLKHLSLRNMQKKKKPKKKPRTKGKYFFIAPA